MLSVGLNASPLAAPRTGVGRYILGLLGGLARLPGAGTDFEARALFAPAALAASSSERAPAASALQRRAFGLLRAAAKRAPYAYALAQAARAASLEALRLRSGLAVYHETNHAAPRARVPVVLTIHDLSTLSMPETQERKRAEHFGRALRERARDAARVVTPTQAIADEVVARLSVPRARVQAIHHGVDEALLAALALERARSNDVGTGPAPVPGRLAALGVRGPYLLFLGALEPRKGLPVLLDAYDALPAHLARAFALVLAGPEERLDAPLRKRLAARREGTLVRPGFVAPAELPALYRGAAAFCLPSQYEGFGLPLLEALACGTPSVASDDPALVEVAAGAALHAPRGDAHALSQTLARLLDDAALRERLARDGPVRAAQFSWEKSARAHLDLYFAAAGR